MVEQREAACPLSKVGHVTGASIEVGFVSWEGTMTHNMSKEGSEGNSEGQ